MYAAGSPSSMAFLWPALVAESASELASVVAHELVDLAIGRDAHKRGPEPRWTTRNEVVLELTTVRLRDFSTAREGVPTLVCAPFALHGATITDFAPDHSLIAALHGAGSARVLVTDWRSATPAMRFLSIDSYLADLNVVVDTIGGTVDLVGLCQGGWMALIYAARFPAKVRKLVLAGAPIDLAAGSSKLSQLARETPLGIFKQLVDLGSGRVLGAHALRFWEPAAPDGEMIAHSLQSAVGTDAAAARLEERFRDWYAWTLDLPGTYYLQVVEQLFKENRLAGGRFVGLGRCIELTDVRCPLFLLAAQDDEVVAPAQIFATERLVGSSLGAIRKATAPCEHLGLFMGKDVLADVWPDVGRWLM
jgi:poly(3-hydroxyalkanoate) synthetase